MVNGHLVTYSFAPERNNVLTDRIKKVLAASYSEDPVVNCTFAEPEEEMYHDRGNAHVP